MKPRLTKKRSTENSNRYTYETLEPRCLLAGIPFFGSPQLVTDNFRLEVETFDLGGEGVAYHDNDPTNTVGLFRPNEGVDIRGANDAGGGFSASSVKTGEWLEFTVDITAGNYDIGARLATNASSASDIELSIGDGINFTPLGVIPTEPTGGWSRYQTFTLPGITLPGGNGQVLRAEILRGGSFNLNWLDFKANPVASPATQAVQNGDWHDPATWDAGVPDNDIRAIIPQGTTVNIAGADHVAKEIVVHGVLNVEESPGTTKTLTTRWIHVNSGGLFQIGSETDRYDQNDFILTLTGTDPLSDHVVGLANGTNVIVNNNDGFLMAAGGGRFQFFGQEKLSFTKLSATANAGASQIQVANLIERNYDGVTSAASDGQVDWEVGDEIVIASSSFDYSHEDVRTITAISSTGGNSILTLDQPLTYRHYGEIESYGQNFAAGTQAPSQQHDIDLRAEVALLSRNVVIKGVDSQDTDVEFGDRALLQTFNDGDRDRTVNGVGGHIMVMNGAGQTTVDGVQLDQLGQAGRLGRYPFHWHFAGNRQGDLLRNVSITNSNNRAVVVHGADNARIEGVVAHDIHGHGFFLESAVETGNEFIANAAFGIHRVGTSLDPDDPFIVDFHDEIRVAGAQFNTSSSFWITNPDNVFIGNTSAGAEGSGYWFGPANEPVNVPTSTSDLATLSRDPYLQAMFNRDPLDSKIRVFDHNTSHSTIVGIVVGEITRLSDRELEIYGGTETDYGELSEISNFTAYKSSTGYYAIVRTANINFSNYRAADNGVSFWDTAPGYLRDSLFVGESRGNAEESPDGRSFAFFLYFQALDLENVHFAGYGFNDFNNTHIFRVGGSNNRFDFVASGISFEDTTNANRIFTRAGGRSNPGVTRPIYDVDGSLTSHLGGGPGYSWVVYDEFWFDGNDGDQVISGQANEFAVALTQKRFGGLRLTNRDGSFGNDFDTDNVRIRVTSPTGDQYEFGGIKGDDPPSNVDPLSRNPRFVTVIGEEYKIEAVRPFDLTTQHFRFAFHGWEFEENTVSNVFQVVGAASLMKPQYYQTGTDLPRVGSLALLRNASESSYFRDPNGDLWMKLFNNTQDTPGIRTQEVFNMVPVTIDPGVKGRHVFYNDSFHDGNDATATASDDAAIATDKSPLLPGQTATFSNYTSYDKGINGVIIDIDGPSDASALSAADFILSTGNGDLISDFSPLSTVPDVSVRVGGGIDGSDRVTLTLPNGLVTGTWLSVTVLANGNTGLAQNDLFYFGNSIGDTGDVSANALVSAADESGARNNHRNFTNRAGADDIYDFNRDSLVTSIDEIIARNNITDFADALQLIVAPTGATQSATANFTQPVTASFTQPVTANFIHSVQPVQLVVTTDDQESIQYSVDNLSTTPPVEPVSSAVEQISLDEIELISVEIHPSNELTVEAPTSSLNFLTAAPATNSSSLSSFVGPRNILLHEALLAAESEANRNLFLGSSYSTEKNGVAEEADNEPIKKIQRIAEEGSKKSDLYFQNYDLENIFSI